VKAVLAATLGDVHGRVGVAHQVLDRVGIARVGAHAHAGPDLQRCPSGHLKGLTQAVDDARGQIGGDVGHVAGALDEQQELVAAGACQNVAVAHDRTQPLADRPQERVAEQVAVAVVDPLEVIDVDEQQGQLTLVSAGLPEGGGHLVLHRPCGWPGR
jgi:hypothetical protein